MFAPARIPVAAGKKMAKTEKKVSSPLKSGPMFSHMITPVMTETQKTRTADKTRSGNNVDIWL